MKKLKFGTSTVVVLIVSCTLLLNSCKKGPLPFVETMMDVFDITVNSATSGGMVPSDEGYVIIARGVCWAEHNQPTIDDYKTSDGDGAGHFISELTGLTPSTKYYVRAYATNENGTSYGSTISFTTLSIEYPTVTTALVYGVTPNSANCGGNVTDDGDSEIIARGVCWSTDEANVTIADFKTEDGSGIGEFSSVLSELQPSTTYYVRAYATNAKGTAYGSKISFTTPGPPSASVLNVDFITMNSCVVNAEVLANNGASIFERGLCWSVNENPTLNDNWERISCGSYNYSCMGTYTGFVHSLNPGTKYYVRSYAKNNHGTGYGNQISFTTLTTDPCEGITSVTDSRDNNTYQVVAIANKCWMAENLRYLPSVNTNSQFSSLGNTGQRAYGVYDYSGSDVNAAKSHVNYMKYGVLYNWYAATNLGGNGNNNPSGIKGACPSGWHLPSQSEYQQLLDYLGEKDYAGGHLKETGEYIHWNSNSGATNTTGFSARGAGNRNAGNGVYYDLRVTTFFWTTTLTEWSNDYPGRFKLYNSGPSASLSGDSAGHGGSVRCVKN